MASRITNAYSENNWNHLGSPLHAILVHNPFCPFSFWRTTNVEHKSPLCTNHITTWLYITFFASGFPVTKFSSPPTLWAIWVFSPTSAEEKPFIIRLDDRFCWLKMIHQQLTKETTKSKCIMIYVTPQRKQKRKTITTKHNVFQHFKHKWMVTIDT